MSWVRYSIAFNVVSPLHIGWRKAGNLQQTRKYVTGKVIWAALTARMTRDLNEGSDQVRYKEMGEKINEYFRFGYFYPALQKNEGIASIEDIEEKYPWHFERFDYLFLDSYASTALDHEVRTSEKGTLHEVEFIAPRTRNGKPIFLKGDIWVQDYLPEELNPWCNSLKHLRLGGERGYGWGQVRLTFMSECSEKSVAGINGKEEVLIRKKKRDHIFAHVNARNITGEITGTIEPLVGWERTSEKDTWRLTRDVTLAFVPGSVVNCDAPFLVDAYGIWRYIPEQPLKD